MCSNKCILWADLVLNCRISKGPKQKLMRQKIRTWNNNNSCKKSCVFSPNLRGRAPLISYLLILACNPIRTKMDVFSPQKMQQIWRQFWDNLSLTLPCPLCCTKILVCIPPSFFGKLYTHQRIEHILGVTFCKCLLVNLLTGRYVCFSYSAFMFSLLPVSITWSNILSWSVYNRGCLIGSNLIKTDPKQAIEWTKTERSAPSCSYKTWFRERIFFYSMKLPFEHAYTSTPNPTPSAWGTLLRLILLIFLSSDFYCCCCCCFCCCCFPL